MKKTLRALLAASSLAPATPPILSHTQVALQQIDPEIQPGQYDIARTDLNHDGHEDVLVLMNGNSAYVGSGGATLFLLKGTASGLESLGSVAVVSPPVCVRTSVHHGFRDILVGVRGGGAQPGLSVLSFDGTRYPASPGDASASRADGDEVLFAEAFPPFDQQATLQGISFRVSSPNLPRNNRLTLTPTGLARDPSTVEIGVVGSIRRIELADLNADGSPEVYVYAFDGVSEILYAWSTNQKKSLSPIFLPELDPAQSAGHRGGDEFAVVEGVLARRFPLGTDEPMGSESSRTFRQIQYRLRAGEAGWQLMVDQTIEF